MPGWFWLALIGGLVIVFASPTLIALIRQADDIGFIVLLNGISIMIPIALPVALVAAIMAPRKKARRQYLPYPPLPPSGSGSNPSAQPGRFPPR
jgi:hypothetical protein